MTSGVILAAGVGSRLRPMTNTKPKCLVTSANKAILQYQLDSYIAAGVTDLYIVVGYEGDAVKEYCRHIKGLNITIIENSLYEDSNNMYSLYLVSEFVKCKPFVLNNADLTISQELVSVMIKDKRPDLVAVDVGYYNDESMKVSLDSDQIIDNISKEIGPNESHGCSIDFYKFSGESSEIFFEEITEIIEVEKNLKDWTEVAMQRLFQTRKLKFCAIDICGMPWVEIDNYEDLALSDKIFSQRDRTLLDYGHYVLDLDGTIHVDGVPIPGVVNAINELRKEGKGISYMSNNSSKSKREYVELLSMMGLDVSDEDIVLSTDGVLEFMRSQEVERIHVLGTKSLEKIVESAGFHVTSVEPEYVVVGYDTELTYAKLVTACRLINDKIDYIATHCDLVCPTEHGPVPDAGLLLDMLERTTGRKPYAVFGKPNVAMIDGVCTRTSAKKSDVLVVGDRLYTDIKMGLEAQIASLLVLTGDTARGDAEVSELKPTYVLNSLADII